MIVLRRGVSMQKKQGGINFYLRCVPALGEFACIPEFETSRPFWQPDK